MVFLWSLAFAESHLFLDVLEFFDLRHFSELLQYLNCFKHEGVRFVHVLYGRVSLNGCVMSCLQPKLLRVHLEGMAKVRCVALLGQ